MKRLAALALFAGGLFAGRAGASEFAPVISTLPDGRVQYLFYWFDLTPDHLHFQAADANVLTVNYERQSQVYTDDGDYGVGSVFCTFPGPRDCVDTFATSDLTLARIFVEGGDARISFRGWPNLPSDYLIDGLPVLSTSVDNYYTFLTITTTPSDSGYMLDRAAPAAFVPEPQTWALLLIGFGATGAWLRRRRPANAGMMLES
jgi:hypothetical protein